MSSNSTPGVTTVTLTSNSLVIIDTLTITGPITIRRGDDTSDFRIFKVDSSGLGINVTMTDVTIDNGYSVDLVTGGGGLYVASSDTVVMQTCTIQNNQTREGVTASYLNGAPGGGIHNAGTLYMSDCIVKANITGGGANSAAGGSGGNGGDGAGIYNQGELTLLNCTITQNITGNGETRSGPGEPGGNGGNGAGLYTAGGTVEITGSTFSDNITGNGGDTSGGTTSTGGSGGSGAAIYVDFGATPFSIINSTISGNLTGDGGDALNDYGGNGGNGAGIYNKMTGITLEISFCTITNNGLGVKGIGGLGDGDDGQGGGIYHSFAATNLWYTILANNAVSALVTDGPDCHSGGGLIDSSGYNLVGIESSIHATAPCGFSGVVASNIYDTDPGLEPLDLNDPGATETHALSYGSPCIDAGETSVTAPYDKDQRQVTRPQSTHLDIGAFESSHYSFSLTKSGTGQGSVVSTPSGIDCNDACPTDSAVFVELTSVELSATAAVDSDFVSWGGDCSGTTSPTTVSVTGATSCTAQFDLKTFTISGTVKKSDETGVPGVTMSNLPNNPVTLADGTYTDQVPYDWSGTVIPTKTGFTFLPVSKEYTNVVADATAEDYTATQHFTLAGVVEDGQGAGIPGVEMQNLPGNPLTAADGSYSVTLPENWLGATVVPKKTGYEFTPASRTYAGISGDLTSEDYNGSEIPPTYTISGIITTSGGTGVSGVTLNGLTGNPVTGADGSYSSVVDEGWGGTVAPTKTGYDFDPVSRTYANVTADMPNQNYTATPLPVTITGYVKTTDGTGLLGVSMAGFPDPVTTVLGGIYVATVPHGWTGTVTPTSADYEFAPVDREYTNVTTHMANQDYTAKHVPVTISGVVQTAGGTGVSGITMAGFPDPVITGAGGAYSGEVPYGWTGSVTPTSADYGFVPISRQYTNLTLDMTGQDYTAAPVPGTFTISGNIFLADSTPVSGVVLQGLPGVPTTDVNGYYSATVSEAWTGTAQPVKAGYIFDPVFRAYPNVIADIPNQNYTATPVFTISGKITLADQTPVSDVVLQGLPGDPATDVNGQYSAVVTEAWTGTVTPVKAGHRFTPDNRTYTAVTSDQTDQDYTATPQFTISGTITTSSENSALVDGANLADVTLNGFPDTVVTDQAGYYEAIVDAGWQGTVIPEKTGYEFVPASITYPPVTGNLELQDYTAYALFTISGRVTTTGDTGLAGVVLNGYPFFDQTYTTDAQGYFEINIKEKYVGHLTPTKTGYQFDPSTIEYADPGVTGDLTDQNFSATVQQATTTPQAVPSGSEQKDYTMSVLGIHPLDPTAVGVFGIAPADYDTTMIRIGRWNPATGVYDEYPLTRETNILPGWTVWILSRDARTFTVQGHAITAIPGPTGNGVYFPVKKGWNQVGNPFRFDIAMNQVRFLTRSSEATVTFWIWDKDRGDYLTIVPNGVIPSRQGGWINAPSAGWIFFAQTATASNISPVSNLEEASADADRPPDPPGSLGSSGSSGGGKEGGGGGCFIQSLAP